MAEAVEPFIVFSLPRSRSCWLSSFLAYDGREVGHDTALMADSLDEFLAPLASGKLAGSCETGAMLGWQAIRARLPKAKLLVVRRPVSEVSMSLLRHGISAWTELVQRDAMLDALARQPEVKSVRFCDLEQPEVCKQVFEFCLQEPWDFDWWQRLACLNIQVQMESRKQLLRDRAPAMLGLKAEIARVTRELPVCQNLQ